MGKTTLAFSIKLVLLFFVGGSFTCQSLADDAEGGRSIRTLEYVLEGRPTFHGETQDLSLDVPRWEQRAPACRFSYDECVSSRGPSLDIKANIAHYKDCAAKAAAAREACGARDAENKAALGTARDRRVEQTPRPQPARAPAARDEVATLECINAKSQYDQESYQLACSVDRFKICRGKGNRVYLERWNQRCVPRY